MILDPTFGYTNGQWKRYFSDLTGAISNCATGVAVNGSDTNSQGILRTDDTGGRCQAYTVKNDISSLPTTITVSSATIKFDVSATSAPNGCDVFALTNNPNATSDATIWTDIFDGNQYASNDTVCNSSGTSKTISLGASALTDIRTLRQASNGDFMFSMVEGDWDSVVGTNEVTLDLVTANIQLQIVYTAPLPDRIDTLTYANLSDTTLDLIWTAPNLNTGNLTNYLINVTSPFGNPQTFLANTTNTYYNVTGRTFGTEYSFRVSVLTEGGYNATGNILNVTTSSTSFSTPPTSLIVFPDSYTSTSQLNLQWIAGSMENVNGYRIERETPTGSGWVTLGSGNTSSTNTYYNDTGLSTNIVYNYRVSSLNGTGISTPSNTYEMTTYHLPNAVIDLVATATNLSTIGITWTAPTSYAPSITGYQVNTTTPYGIPQTITVNSPISGSLLSATVTGLTIGNGYSVRIAPITFHGYNASGNIANATTISQFAVGDLPDIDTANTNDAQIFFNRTDTGSTVQLDVTYSNTYDLACDMSYKYARTNQTYYPLSSSSQTLTSATDDVYSRFTFYNATNEVIRVKCWDVIGDDSAKYVITVTDFPLLQQINNLRNGTYGTMGEFGAIDLVSLLVVIVSMVGLNRINPIAGVIFVVIAEFSLAYFGIVQIPQVLMVGFATVIMIAIMATRKDD